MSFEVILGSSSPRRADLLAQIGVSFTVVKPEIEEVLLPGEEPRDYVRRMAQDKSRAVLAKLGTLTSHPHPLVLTADTVVLRDGEVLEKPKNQADARAMLGSLSGRSHEVFTAVCLASAERSTWFGVTTQVHMKEFTPEEIDAYVQTGEPMDKAGSYAAQGRGSCLIAQVNGSYSNVVGLPLFETVGHLQKEFGILLWESWPKRPSPT